MSDTISYAEKFGFSAADAKMISDIAFDMVDAGNLDGAATIFIGLLAINPMDAAIRAALGAVFQRQGKLEEAQAEYAQALEIDPSTPLARLNRGELRLKTGDQGGIDDLTQVANGQSPLRDRAARLLAASSPQP